MKPPKLAEYYEYLFQSYRKEGKDSNHQYRINGQIVNDETYYDTRSELIQRGAEIYKCYDDCIGHNVIRTSIWVLLKKEAL